MSNGTRKIGLKRSFYHVLGPFWSFCFCSSTPWQTFMISIILVEKNLWVSQYQEFSYPIQDLRARLKLNPFPTPKCNMKCPRFSSWTFTSSTKSTECRVPDQVVWITRENSLERHDQRWGRWLEQRHLFLDPLPSTSKTVPSAHVPYTVFKLHSSSVTSTLPNSPPVSHLCG